MTCSHILVMGVAGSGKSTIGAGLADALRSEFVEGDSYHPPSNVEKMAAGVPLTDADREPWLANLGELLTHRHARGEDTVLACSALRRAYRDRLRSAVPANESFAILLMADAPTLAHRLEARRGHYMPAALLGSQLATLEPLDPDEVGVTIEASVSAADVLARALAAVRAWHATLPAGR